MSLLPKDDLKWFLYEESAGPLSILAQLRAIREVLRHTLAVEPMTPEILAQMPSKHELVERLRIPATDQGVDG